MLKLNGDRALSVAGLALWNALHKDIRLCATLAAFKTSLKTKNICLKKTYMVWLCTQLIYFYFRFDSTIYIEFFLYIFIASAVSVIIIHN